MWNVIEIVTNKSIQPNMTSLQAGIEETFLNIDKLELQ